MIIDNELVFSDSQAITASAASTNIIDLGAMGQGDLGNSRSLEILVQTTQAFNNLTSLGIKLQTCASEDFSSTTVYDLPLQETVTLASGNLAINKEILRGKIPHGCLRYVRLYYTVAGSSPSTGKVFATMVYDRQAGF
jgi:hypothetical protein